MASQGLEHVYLQQWLVAILSNDPFLESSIVQGRIAESPELIAELPSIVFKAGPNVETVLYAGPTRAQRRIPMGIEVHRAGMDIEPLLPPANRIDVLLSATRNVVWAAPDGSTLTIYNITSDRPYSDTVLINEDEPIRILGEDWTFTVAVQLPAGYFD